MNISQHADYRPELRSFNREQSRLLRTRQWAERETPVSGWGTRLAHGIGWVITMAIIILVSSYVG